MELEDLVYTYPNQYDERIQTILSSKEEFRETGAALREPVPKPGELFRHQRLFKRLMLQYDNVLNIFSTGAGKTMSVLSVTEHFHALARALEEFRIDSQNVEVPYKRAYILVKGNTIAEVFKKEIVCKANPEFFLTPQILNSKTEKARKSNITRSINKFYSILTYGTFAKALLKMTDAQLQQNFSHCIFIVDEVHNINPDTHLGVERTDPITGNKYYVRRVKNKKKPSNFTDLNEGIFKEVIVESRLIYDQLWRLFHTVMPRKVMLLSATPMINDPSELGPRMNLILPRDRQIPSNLDYKIVTLEQMEPYFRGMISYVRELDTGAIPVYQGEALQTTYDLTKIRSLNRLMKFNQELPEVLEPDLAEGEEEPLTSEEVESIEDSSNINDPEEDMIAISTGNVSLEHDKKEHGLVKAQLVVYSTEMRGMQENTYRVSLEDPMKLRPDSKKPQAFADLQRQAANFVFPDGSTGNSGYKKYIIEGGNEFSATDELWDAISDPNQLREMSAKYYEIIRLCKTEPGSCWCYSNFIRGSGAIVLGLCFEAQGFERYDEMSSVFASTGGAALAPLCGNNKIQNNASIKNVDISEQHPPAEERYPDNRTRKIRIEKKLRYALLTSETKPVEADSLLELFNSYENRHGEYIKAVIGSPVTRDGLNLANVLQIHLVGPGWNQAGAYQAESRAIRSTSHVDLVEEERQRLIAEGKDPDTAYVTIRVYRHAATLPSSWRSPSFSDDDEEREEGLRHEEEEKNSIDISMYELSEIKDREIRRILRIMKQVAVDCQLNYARNVRKNDINGSAACDYDICQYKCYSPLPLSIDYSSYDVLYSQGLIDTIKKEIIDIFRVIFSIPYSSLYEELQEYVISSTQEKDQTEQKRKFVDLAVAELIQNKVGMIDRYGFLSYLREDRGTLFLRRDYPLGLNELPSSVTLTEYTSNLIGLNEMTLNEYNGELQRGETGDILDLLKDQETEEEKTATIEGLTLENKILLVETAVTKYVNKNREKEKDVTGDIDFVIKYFRSYIFSVPEPTKALEVAQRAFENRGKGRGRKPKAGTKFKLSEKVQEEVDEILQELEEKEEKQNKPKKEKKQNKQKKEKKEIIYFHNLQTLNVGLSSYSITAKSKKYEGDIRMLKLSEGIGWRDVNEYEETIYSSVIKNKMEQQGEEFSEFEIYGTFLEDGKFRIIDKTIENIEANKDTRKVKRGRICTTMNKKDLFMLLQKIQFNPFNIQVDLSRNELVEYLVEQTLGTKNEMNEYSMDDLKLFYLWLTSGANKEGICEKIQEFFEEQGRIIVTKMT